MQGQCSFLWLDGEGLEDSFFGGVWVGQGESLVWPEESQFWLRWERGWAEAG